jgi:hypothetical protein
MDIFVMYLASFIYSPSLTSQIKCALLLQFNNLLLHLKKNHYAYGYKVQRVAFKRHLFLLPKSIGNLFIAWKSKNLFIAWKSKNLFIAWKSKNWKENAFMHAG